MSADVKTIGFLGAGNMAEALCRSVLASDLASPDSVIAYDPKRERLDLFEKQLGCRTAATPEEVLRVFDGKIAAVLGGGPARLRVPSTVVRVLDGDLEVLSSHSPPRPEPIPPV